MNELNKYTNFKLLLISLISAVFIIYTNITWLPWELNSLKESARTNHLIFFAFRYVFFCILIFLLVKTNLRKFSKQSFNKRFLYNILICIIAFGIFTGIAILFFPRASHFGSILLFQFFVICFLCTFIGHIYQLYTIQSKKEQEIEHLKMENLQSRYNAMMNQINPHFLFNSLTGITALIKKKNDDNTLAYVNKMSDVFRYILQSDKKGLVALEEELVFVNAFFYMMEVRFANKLEFKIDVDSKMMHHKLPTLSILPLIENVVVHNRIDGEHKMTVSIRLNEQNELVISNPVYPKRNPPDTNGTGLINLSNRFILLTNKQIRIEENDDMYHVYLPLI